MRNVTVKLQRQKRFPSPCGVLVLKIAPTFRLFLAREALFPSPCGVLVLKIAPTFRLFLAGEALFPSPCGVLVLKIDFSFDADGFWIQNGFRPLAGFWFLKDGQRMTLAKDFYEVSVPLRGSGS